MTMAIRVNGYTATPIRPDQVGFVTNNVIDPPSISDNRYYYQRGGLWTKIFPSDATNVEGDFIVDCEDVKWAYIDDPVTGLPVYDPGSSVQPVWRNIDTQEITRRTLKILGVRFSDRDFQGYGNSVIQTGN